MSTYYFDGHTAISDPNSVWTNDTNAFDNDSSVTPTTAATCVSLGSTSSNYLLGEGTNSPNTGAVIKSVSARYYGGRLALGDQITVNIYTNSQAELLYSIPKITSATWTSFSALTEPTGGWTWQKIQDLEVLIFCNNISGGTGITISKIELEVTTESQFQNYGKSIEVGNGMSRSGKAN